MFGCVRLQNNASEEKKTLAPLKDTSTVNLPNFLCYVSATKLYLVYGMEELQ
jgi:hypothetical protein